MTVWEWLVSVEAWHQGPGGGSSPVVLVWWVRFDLYLESYLEMCIDSSSMGYFVV